MDMEEDQGGSLDDWSGESTVGYGQPPVVPQEALPLILFEAPPDEEKIDDDGVPFEHNGLVSCFMRPDSQNRF